MLSLSAVFVIRSLRYPSRALQEFTLRSNQDVFLLKPFYGKLSDSDEVDGHHSSATRLNATSIHSSSTLTSGRRQNASADRIDFTKLVSEANSPPWALFYNIFVPLNENDNDAAPSSDTANHTSSQHHLSEAQRGALNIVREQLGQIRHSYAAQRYFSSHNKTLHVFYNSIGTPLDSNYMNDVCQSDPSHAHITPLNCIPMHHYASAFEEVTLQRVWEYCQDFPHHKVMYMHSKGSYNSRGGRNLHWRRHMTHAIGHEDCIESLSSTSLTNATMTTTTTRTTQQPQQCNMCGLVFNPIPWIHYSGNFFTADCGYIRQLLPLDRYRQQMNELANLTRHEHMKHHRILFQLWPDKDAYLGLERYASEAWPGSHPDLIPCDLSLDRAIDSWKKERVPAPAAPSIAMLRSNNATMNHTWTTSPIGNVEHLLQVSVAPRASEPRGKDMFMRKYRYDDSRRLREYYLLAGNMLKWHYLYGTVPRNTSWVWSFYPDGATWRRAHEEQVLLLLASQPAGGNNNNNNADNDYNRRLANAVLEAVVSSHPLVLSVSAPG